MQNDASAVRHYGRVVSDPVEVPVVAVVGPTASGKSDLAIGLAQQIGGEVVNGDSMQLYRGMNIGTAKVPESARRGIRHHLLDILDVTQPATVAEFQALARTAIADCRARGVTPILAGGSALYVRAVVDRFEFPGTDERIRTRVERELAEVGAEVMHARLRDADPAAAAAILPSNVRRIVRALEVIELTGRPFTAQLPPRDYVYERVVQIGLDVPRDVLDERIAGRVEAMWSAGLVDEVRKLEKAGLRQGRTAAKALGYAQTLGYLDGTLSETDAKADTVTATRRFARRQDSWFRKDDRVEWVRFDAADPSKIAVSYDLRP